MTDLCDVLTTVRRARGLTQAELADAANVTQAALSRYEHDLRTPDPETTARLAAALRVTPELLTKGGQLRAAMAVDAHMRRRATAKATVWRQLEAQLNLYRLHAHALFEHVSLHADQTVPTLDPIEVRAADAARIVRMQWKIPVGPVHDLVGWLEAAGCVIFEEDFGTSRVDGLSQWIGDHPVIYLNQRSPTDRKRLTLAHELAHLVLHGEILTDDPEGEANQFAAEFLMPAEMIRPQLRNLTIGRLGDLKLEWMVSMQALMERAATLGTVTPTQRTSFYKRISALGWRAREPFSDELLPERPTLPEKIGTKLVDSGLSTDEVAQMAGFADPGASPFQPRQRELRAV